MILKRKLNKLTAKQCHSRYVLVSQTKQVIAQRGNHIWNCTDSIKNSKVFLYLLLVCHLVCNVGGVIMWISLCLSNEYYNFSM
jgi:hypothetical protein